MGSTFSFIINVELKFTQVTILFLKGIKRYFRT